MSSFINLSHHFTMPPITFQIEYHKKNVSTSVSAAVQVVNPQVEKTSHFMKGVFATLRNGTRKILNKVSHLQKKCTDKVVKIYSKVAAVIKETWRNTDPKKIKAHLPSALWNGFLLTIGGAALCAFASLVVMASFVASPYNPSAGLALIGIFAEVLGLTSMIGGLAMMLKHS